MNLLMLLACAGTADPASDNDTSSVDTALEDPCTAFWSFTMGTTWDYRYTHDDFPGSFTTTIQSQNDDGTYTVEYDDGYFEDLPVNLLRVKRRKVAAPPAAGAYQIGDRVEARYMDGNWFPGKVKTCHKEGTYAIKFDDGDVDDLVFPCDMRAAP